MPQVKRCKDCMAEEVGLPKVSPRPAPHPGPRCATHHRARKKALKRASHARWILKTYGITSDQYWALYEAQGGHCHICQRATGATKLLAVDHDHATGYVRGLLCGPCNQILGHLRDDYKMAYRIYDYLMDGAPAPDVIGWVKPDAS